MARNFTAYLPILDGVSYAGMHQEFTTDEVLTEYTANAISSGTAAISDAFRTGAVVLANSGTTENSGYNMQRDAENFQLLAAKDHWIYFSFQASDADQVDVHLGYGITDSDVLGGITDFIGFRVVDGSASIRFVAIKNSVEAVNVVVGTLADATTTDLVARITMDPLVAGKGTYSVFVDGAQGAFGTATGLPEDEVLAETLEFVSGAAAAQTCTILCSGNRQEV